MTEELAVFKDAAFGYEGRSAVHSLNFSIIKGDYLCIIGENGSGKSTLVKGLLRLIKPLSGTVSFSGELKGGIGSLSQDYSSRKDFPASVEEVVLSGCLRKMGWKPFITKAEKQEAYFNMERLKISSLKNECFCGLSGGQMRRVLLARALCAGSSLLVLDEPAAGLDQQACVDLYKLLQELNSEGRTIVMVSHNIPEILKYAKHILHLKTKQVFFGGASEYERA